MPKISVIIPFYNRINWLVDAVNSVLNQTYSDFEIILINDGSVEPVDSIDELRDERIRYISQENKGASAARNAGISLASGEYVAFLDSDDLFLPNKLALQLSIMEENPNIGLTHTSYIRIDASGVYIENINSGKLSGIVYPRIIYDCMIATPTVMVRRNILDGVMFDENMKYGEDIILWTQIAKLYPILGITEYLTKVRIHVDNAVNNPQAQLIGNLGALQHVLKNDNSLSKSFLLRAKSRIFSSVGHAYIEIGDKKRALKYVILGMLYWPIDSHHCWRIMELMVPTKYKHVLKRIQKRKN